MLARSSMSLLEANFFKNAILPRQHVHRTFVQLNPLQTIHEMGGNQEIVIYG